jgi:hypothetical protein
MPRAEYLRDFESRDSRAEFEALLDRAERWFELPLVPGSTLEAIRDSPEKRAEQYAAVGAYLARHCQVLIALWNGVSVPDVGGTSEVVATRLRRMPGHHEGNGHHALLAPSAAEGSFLDPGESGPLFHVVTPRRDHSSIEGEPLALHVHLPGEEGHGEGGTFDRVCENIDQYNENALRVAADAALAASRDESAGYLLPEAEVAALPPALQALRQQYAVADTLAQHFQRLTFRTLARLCVLVFTAVLSFELSAKLFPDNGWLALLFPAMLGLTYLYWGATVRRGKWQDRYQDYRALAEGLRVQFYWSLASLPDSVADHYLRKQRGELDWIRIAIRNLTECRVQSAGCKAEGGNAHSALCTLHSVVLEYWVTSQARYFVRAAHRDEAKLERFEAWVKALVVASPVVAAAMALAMVLPTPLADWIHHQVYVHKLLIVLVFLLAGVAGVLHTYADKLALAQHVKQYERMGTLFALAEARLTHALRAEDGEASRILLELGKEALAENGDWVLAHRERPVDVPHAG